MFKIGSGDHELADTDGRGAGDDGGEIGRVGRVGVMVVEALVGAICEVDTDLCAIAMSRMNLLKEKKSLLNECLVVGEGQISGQDVVSVTVGIIRRT